MNRTVRFHELGGPEVLRIEHLPSRDPGPGEVRLRVEAIGLNRAEALFRQNLYTQKPELPSRIGYDAVGVVDAVGPEVHGVLPGERVATIPAFQMTQHGVYGDEAVVPARAIAPWPDALAAEEAAALWTAWLTVWGGLVKDGEVRRGDWVLLPAAASSVGIAAIQVARSEGAKTIATTRNPAKRDALLRAGADEVVVTSTEDLAARVLAITGGRGVDVAFDPVAGKAIETTAGSLAPRGRLVIYGYLGGMDAPLPLVPMLRKRLTLRAHSIFQTTNDPDATAEAKAYVLRGVASGAFRPLVDRVFSLDDIVEAHRALEADAQVGKIVVTT
ncbi:MAG TPA: zinc-dependent alcohol dehydrogenase family protein, partial [Polyangiaceae bacterium]|nr:zinc-dependent alcohol dehydrogenase family protein [Polyangiaceae bacterium]